MSPECFLSGEVQANSLWNKGKAVPNGRGGARTRTELPLHGILSPVRLPISPLGLREDGIRSPPNCKRFATICLPLLIHISLDPLFMMADMSGIDGFLGFRGSIGMDIVVVGLLLLLPILALSIYLVRVKKQFFTHKMLQLFIAGALLICIVIFEIDIRFVSDWKERARPSPWWPTGVLTALGIHLVFAISTLIFLVWTLWESLYRFPSPPIPSQHSRRHRFFGRLVAMDLLCTTITGLTFYWLAFVASS